MGRAVIKKIIGVRDNITTVELEHGGEATGYGTDWKVGENVIEVFHDKYHRIKILKLKSS